jgi:DNA-directed RNA polymerase subunit RPC12/RpoP
MKREKFQLLRRFQYSSEAMIYSGKLESQGIEVFLRDSNTIDSNPLYSNAVGGVKLFVKTENYEKANAILSEISNYSFEDNNELIKCSKCGEEQINMVTSIKNWRSLLSFAFSLLVILIPFHSKYLYKCKNCKTEFN